MNSLRNCIASLETESGGAVVVQIICPSDYPDLVADALMADPIALRLYRSLTTCLRQIAKAPRNKPALCGCCPRRVGTGYSVCVASDIHQSAMAALQRIWPTAHSISLANWHDGGRA